MKPAVGEALHESASMRAVAGVDLASEPAPDETTVCKFRHLFERKGVPFDVDQSPAKANVYVAAEMKANHLDPADTEERNV